MADKKYKLNFELSDGSVQSVEFVVPQGEKGADGVNGVDGIDGVDGKSAYEYAKEGGYTGTETEFYEALAKITDILQQVMAYFISTNLTGVTGSSSNPTTIYDDGTVEMIFTANSGYILPDTIGVVGAAYNWNKSTGELTLTNPTGDVTISITAEEINYPITTNLIGAIGVSSNPTTMTVGSPSSLYFTAKDGYELPDELTVVGAKYTWDSSSGLLILSNPTGNVTVTIECLAIDNYLMFLSDEGDFTVTATNVEWDGTVEYSTDKSTWITWDGSAIPSSSNKLYMRGSENTTFYISNGMRLTLSRKAGCYGNLNTLLDYRKLPTKLTTTSCFQSMFENCTNLTQAPELPATTLYPNCYQQMFRGCTSLTQAPELPATELSPYCYYKMFSGCTNLTQAPELPAMTLKNFCYQDMFSDCTSLTQAPELPATTATAFCYYQMFRGCSSLTQTPKLPAKILASQCYCGMFSDCTSLTRVPDLPATSLKGGCYQSMFSGCTGIKLSLTETDDYQTPYCISISTNDTTEANALTYMFSLTGGTFTGTPTINTTYYGAWSKI